MEKMMFTPVEKTFKHGLIVGKFFPPHDGHLQLIQSAAFFCESLTVGIFDHERSVLPLHIRKEAFEKELGNFTNIRITFAEDNIPIDAVFTADDYGDELARRLNCTHVRLSRSFAATTFRNDPIQHWSRILPTIQSWLCKRIVLVGSESTGKTTLSQQLVAYFQNKNGPYTQTQWVPEYGRDYSYLKLGIIQGIAKKNQKPEPWMNDVIWTEKDFLHIANMQMEMENKAAQSSGPILICDTDSFATAIWNERYMDYFPQNLEPVISKLSQRTLYLLTDHVGILFVQDGIRDGEHKRAWMTQRFEDEMTRRKLPFIKLQGSFETRFRTAVVEIEKRLCWNWE